MIRKKIALAQIYVCQNAFKIGAVFVAIFLILYFYEGKVVLAPGVRAPDTPRQVSAKTLDPRPEPWLAKEHTFYPLASYSIEAKVLGKVRYRKDREAELSPYDLALGWQELSDQAVVDKISFSQRARWYYYKNSDSSISQDTIKLKSSNNHIIPANDEVLDVIHKIRTGDIVELSGYLVIVRDGKDWKWRSSLSRSDSEDNSCEVFWVDSAKITTP
jgi:hypothetical protein